MTLYRLTNTGLRVSSLFRKTRVASSTPRASASRPPDGFSRRAVSSAAELDREGVRQPHLLQRGRQRRPLRRLGAAAAVLRRDPRGVRSLRHRTAFERAFGKEILLSSSSAPHCRPGRPRLPSLERPTFRPVSPIRSRAGISTPVACGRTRSSAARGRRCSCIAGRITGTPGAWSCRRWPGTTRSSPSTSVPSGCPTSPRTGTTPAPRQRPGRADGRPRPRAVRRGRQ
jgi:hypothetical protein